ncbi:MAG: flavoprotein, partial [Caulobacterales bacterium]
MPDAGRIRGETPLPNTLDGKRILLIVGGGIAAYKSLELVRLLKKAGHQVTPVLTKSGE